MSTVISCSFCKKDFLCSVRRINVARKRNQKNLYCSRKCLYAFKTTSTRSQCRQCLCEIFVQRHDKAKKFCSHSCGASYQNTHKTTGTRVSKLERWLATELTKKYPNLEFHFNRKDAINSELDIYIPSLKLAFELNGIFHHEPIFGADKLNKIQNNDNRKFQACLERQIELCIIDTSTFKHFKEVKAIRFFNIVVNIIQGKLVLKTGLEPVLP